MPTITDFLLGSTGGTTGPVTGVWVRLQNNSTLATFVANAATDALGTFTVASVPPGTYTVATGPTSLGPFTVTTDTNYFIGADVGAANTFAGALTVQGAITGTGALASGPATITGTLATSSDIAAGGNVSIHGANPWVDITAFGGKADGSTDNTSALTNALNALPSAGGTVFFPPSASAYVFASAWNLTAKTAVRVQGAGPGRTGGSPTGTFIRFSGTSGPLIAASGTTNIELADLWIFWPSAFTGTVTDLSGTTFARVSGCSYFANGGGNAAALLIGLDTVTRAVIERCVLHNAQIGIQGIATGGHFSNAVVIEKCNFSSSAGDILTALINNPGQGWEIHGNNFELGTGAGVVTAIGQSLGGSLGVSVTGNWFGDSGTGAQTAIDINGDGWLVAGNIIGLNSNAGSMFINQRSGANGLSVTGNRLQNSGLGITFGGSNRDVFVMGNRWNGITTQYSGSPLNGLLESPTGSGGLQVFGSLQRSAQTPTETVLVSGVDATLGEHVGVTLSAARLVGAPLNPASGDHLYFTFTQGGAGGFAVTWNAVFKVTWADTGNTTGKISTVGFEYNGTNWVQIGAQAPYV